MSEVTTTQPYGTPTWIDLGVPDLDRAMEFYGALFGWEFEVGPDDMGSYTNCLLRGKRVAGLARDPDPESTDHFWNVYLATDDCASTVGRITGAGGTVLVGPMEIPGQGTMAVAFDPTGGQFALWQGGGHIGCDLVNEPNTLVRNDLITPTPEPARAFYRAVFDFSLDGNPDMPELDFSFLRRPDGHEIGGIIGSPAAARSRWNTTFEVDDTDAAVRRATAGGATVSTVEEMPYGKIATLDDPFGAEISLITRSG